MAAGIADRGRAADSWLVGVARWAWRTRISSRLVVDLRVRLREVAEEGAVGVFAGNLRDLLLAAPAGARPTMGLDPGLRTGVKVAVVDGTGKVVAHETIYPHVPRNQWDQSLATLARLARDHGVELIAIGNGTASRETHKLAQQLALSTPGLIPAMVSEAGASVYSASEEASKELPDLDVSIRGAVSIARRLQDPLAELVKIDPKSIGVGQYQHDVSATLLSRSLDGVVEDCVNAVGVDVNTASAPLLRRVSGISSGLATTIVGYRDEHGPFASRTALTKVPRLGAKAFEQSAGFLRIPDATDPLDRSGVHPEAYPVVRRIVEKTGTDVASLVGNSALLGRLDPGEFTDETFGVPTVTDIIAELDKPGRDPRPAFETATFAEGVEQITDLVPGMVLEGVVTNVAAFGAFVDVGVHQDGLVHISAMSKEFVSDPRAVVGPGDVVRVKVLDVDVPRKRISLTLRLEDEPGAGGGERPGGGRGGGRSGERREGDAGGGRGKGGPPSGRQGGKPDGGRPQGGQGGAAAGPGGPGGPVHGRPRGGKPRDGQGGEPRDGQAGPPEGGHGQPGGGEGATPDSGRPQGGRGGKPQSGKPQSGKPRSGKPQSDKPQGGGQGGKPPGGGQSGKPQGGGRRGGNDRDRRPAPSGAMADALRRAGFDR